MSRAALATGAVAIAVLLLVVLGFLGTGRCALLATARATTRDDPMSLPAFVIGLDRHAAARRDRTVARLRLAGHLDVRPVAAVDAFDPRAAPVIAAEHVAGVPGVLFTTGERGCAASHLRVLRAIVGGGFPLAVVYEDDAVPADGYAPLFRRVVRARGAFDLIYLGHMTAHPPGRGLVVPGRTHGMHAYLTTRAGATKVLASARGAGVKEPLDIQIHDGKVYEGGGDPLTTAVVNHHAAAVAAPVRFEGKPRDNRRSYGIVAQDHRMHTSIKARELRGWTK